MKTKNPMDNSVKSNLPVANGVSITFALTDGRQIRIAADARPANEGLNFMLYDATGSWVSTPLVIKGDGSLMLNAPVEMRGQLNFKQTNDGPVFPVSNDTGYIRILSLGNAKALAIAYYDKDMNWVKNLQLFNV